MPAAENCHKPNDEEHREGVIELYNRYKNLIPKLKAKYSNVFLHPHADTTAEVIYADAIEKLSSITDPKIVSADAINKSAFLWTRLNWRCLDLYRQLNSSSLGKIVPLTPAMENNIANEPYDDAAEDHHLTHEQLQALMKASLRPEQHKLINDFYLDGVTNIQLAKEWNISVRAMDNKLYRIRKKLWNLVKKLKP